MEITNKELAYSLIREYGIASAKELANLAWRKYNIEVKPAAMAGALRPFIKTGRVGSSKDSSGTHYWINREIDEQFNNEVELNDLTGLYRFKKGLR